MRKSGSKLASMMLCTGAVFVLETNLRNPTIPNKTDKLSD